ncbi:GATA zinc finger domain containing 1 [Rhinolophus ferrumequinum]|uniref:GATA zinc finger domain-containing protein 1 n=1 Tax=Rhinolophus ferrumequinum TaxID=59479 RepID=A0A7J7TLY2_RHIFE|nr:GATA zinc finger domain containing 1 [Rhinolophus ferrumequinum]
MPLGLKPTCSVCKTTSSSMWKKGPQGEILCHHCTGRGGAGGGGGGSGAASGTGGSSSGGGFGAATFASTSAAPPQSNGGGSGKQSKQEIHRRSARLRNTKYKSAPAAEKKVSTKGKGRRHIFKLKNLLFFLWKNIKYESERNKSWVHFIGFFMQRIMVLGKASPLKLLSQFPP